MCFWQEQWSITYSQTAVSAVWLVVVHDGRCSQEEFPFFNTSPHWSLFCPQWTHCCIYKDYFWTCCLCILLKLNVLLDVKVDWECWLKSFLWLLLKMLFYCFIVFFLQTNKQINCQVKTLERKTNKINSLLAEDQNADCFFFFSFFFQLK